MSDYPINLPKTSFPMKADLAKREGRIAKIWQDLDLYQKIRALRKDAPLYVLHDGPPYANGPAHLGHALNKTLKDIALKSQVLLGKNIFHVPGWDCHGLPIVINVEKKLGEKENKVDPKLFIATCRQYATSQVELQKNAFLRLGLIGDFDHPYKTMDFDYEADVMQACIKIWENGYIIRGNKPVYWCIDCGSALAEAEVEYQDKASPAIDIKFKVSDPNKFIAQFGLKIEELEEIIFPVWTTTPWTLPANEAVALSAKIIYSLIYVKKSRQVLVIAKELQDGVLNRYQITDFQIIAEASGNTFEHYFLQHPFLDKKVPVILGEHVTIEAGTGAVHTAPAHGQDDFLVGLKYKLPQKNPVGENGCFLPDTPLVAGEHVFRANPKIIEILKTKGNLLAEENITHSYPHCWRHKTPLIFRLTPQWFISLEKNNLREKTLAEIEQIRSLPQYGQERMRDMVEKRPDWCISRQRIWGTPIPLFIHQKTEEVHPKMKEIFLEKILPLIRKEGVIAWHNLNLADVLGKEALDYRKNTDTLDVWFDAGLSHYCVGQRLKREGDKIFGEIVKSDVYIEGSDQYRGWFQSALITAVALSEAKPYHTLISHGYTVDAAGRKMSKSLGNVVDPANIIKVHGADIVRLWVGSLNYHNDTACSDEILKGIVDVYRNIRNTIRYCLGNLFDFQPATDLKKGLQLLALDFRFLEEIVDFQKECLRDYQNYKFYSVFDRLRVLCSAFSNYYFDVTKDRLYTMPAKSVGRCSAQTVLYNMLEILVRIIAPILSFTAEETWQLMKEIFPEKRAESVFLETFYQGHEKLPLNNLRDFEVIFEQKEWEKIDEVRRSVYKELEALRKNGVIGSNLEATVKIYCDNDLYALLQEFEHHPTSNEKLEQSELRFLLITSSVEVLPLKEKTPQAVSLGNIWVEVAKSEHPKCARCWHRVKDIGRDQKHPELCPRCTKNLENPGEERYFA